MWIIVAWLMIVFTLNNHLHVRLRSRRGCIKYHEYQSTYPVSVLIFTPMAIYITVYLIHKTIYWGNSISDNNRNSSGSPQCHQLDSIPSTWSPLIICAVFSDTATLSTFTSVVFFLTHFRTIIINCIDGKRSRRSGTPRFSDIILIVVRLLRLSLNIFLSHSKLPRWEPVSWSVLVFSWRCVDFCIVLHLADIGVVISSDIS